MRQLRIQSELCHKKQAIDEHRLTCQQDYSLFNEEKRAFLPGWNQTNPRNYSALILSAFHYQTSKQLDTYMYAGDHANYASGGYVFEFRGRLTDMQSNLSQLHQLGWIDDQTRAVIIQFSLFNPNVNMFTSVTLLVEMLSTGAIIPTVRFEPIDLQSRL